jgi:hypothetical protein
MLPVFAPAAFENVIKARVLFGVRMYERMPIREPSILYRLIAEMRKKYIETYFRRKIIYFPPCSFLTNEHNLSPIKYKAIAWRKNYKVLHEGNAAFERCQVTKCFHLSMKANLSGLSGNVIVLTFMPMSS